MSEPIPERADVRQLRTQAKELLRDLQSGKAHSDDVQPATAKLADAQRLIARKHGFESWPKLIDQLETPILIDQFKNALELGDSAKLDKLLRTKPALRRRINDPSFSFDSPAIVAATHFPNAAQVLPILVRYGADPNIRSTWWAGGFGALDAARGEAAEVLLRLGAKYDVWSAASHGRLDILRELLDADPALINAPGGDGGTPLHFAANAEVAQFLIQRGAELEKKDVDHEGTPIQHHIHDEQIVRVLLRNGARPDIFTAATLDDPELASTILAADPSAVDAAVGKGDFAAKKSDGGHIYAYRIGPGMTPHAWAAKEGHRKVLGALLKSAPATTRLLSAAWLEDEEEVEAVLSQHPGIGKEMGGEARSITDAAQQGKTETVRLLLKSGLDPLAQGMGGGNALQVASWFGFIDIVRLLIDRVSPDLKDPTHGSPALGWAAHGAQNCRNHAGDYVAVVETLIRGGADPRAPANSQGVSMLAQAGSRDDVKDVLRKYGAR